MVENHPRGASRLSALFVGAVLLSSPAAWAQQRSSSHWDESKLSQPTYKVIMEKDVGVRMRDGVVLSNDITRPDAPGRFPVLFRRNTYNNNTQSEFEQDRWYAERGYVVVNQDVRGKYDSEGKYRLFANEFNDGYDSDEWISRQPWSNGKIGTLSGSYGGYVQITQGVGRHKALNNMAASVTTGDVFNNWMYTDGALFLGFAFPWGALVMDGHGMQYSGGYDWPQVFRHLPLSTMDTAVGHVNESYREILKHPRADDPFWRNISFANEIQKVEVPFLVVEGWYDLFLRGALEDHIKIVNGSKSKLAREQKRLFIGPWTHETGRSHSAPSAPTTGLERNVDFGEAAAMDLQKLYLRWQDHWLKGIDNGVDREPQVKIFVMGENYWRFENEWPLARTQYTKYYLQSAGKANSAAGDGTLSASAPGSSASSDQYRYDPNDPVPTLGGNTCCSTVPTGPWNQARAEARNDVLVYTTPVLTEPVEVTGPIKMKLFASSSARDTDWTAKLVDVHPDGYAQNLQDGIVRARYRGGVTTKASLLEPGKVYEYEIDMSATSNVFLPGHRIRIEVSSSNFPRFDRNLNTGEDPMTGTRMETATQTVYHSAEYPSHIVLPIIPRVSSALRTGCTGQARGDNCGLPDVHAR